MSTGHLFWRVCILTLFLLMIFGRIFILFIEHTRLPTFSIVLFIDGLIAYEGLKLRVDGM